MGRIFEEVELSHLRYNSAEREAILPFVGEFDVTWGASRSAYGSSFSSYIVKPNSVIRSLFGLGMEVALFVFDYTTIEPRTFQAINQVLEEDPLAGRVEPGVYFIISRDPNASQWVADYISRTAQTRTPIPLAFSQLRLALTDPYALRDLISSVLYRRDLFDYKLPINDDTYFFGRESQISELLDQIKKGQNTGIFGLRKTGKTSLLYKVSRRSEVNKISKTLYVDCKSPTIRKKTADQLIDYITRHIAEQFAIPSKSLAKLDTYEKFEEAMRLAARRGKFCIIFDEIEYISPYSLTDAHWKVDFIDFWQLMWSTQSKTGHLSFIISGVNAAVCEADTFQNIQNPLFGIVKIIYLRGLEPESLRVMVRHFGGHMGLNFSDAAINVLEEQYGGHPLLTRMACSHVHKELEALNRHRPINISKDYASRTISGSNPEIMPYCAHIVSELKTFYPDEFEVLKMSAVGLKTDFYEFSQSPELIRHLRAYGIVRLVDDAAPEIVLPVLRDFLKAEHARETGGSLSRHQVPTERRPRWVQEVLNRVIHDTRTLLQSAPPEMKRPFGGRGLPDSDLLLEAPEAVNEDTFGVFIAKMYKVFYENVVRAYDKGEFFSTFKAEWPYIFGAIDRIRVYRDIHLHLDVSDGTRVSYKKYLSIDLGGSDPKDVKDGYFSLQQSILDELLYSIQLELADKVQ